MNTIAENYASLVSQSCASMVGGEVGVKPMNGRTAFTFPCPFCSPMRSKASKQRSKDAILMPRVDKPYCLTFKCMGHKSCRKTYNFQEFLENWNPSIAQSYKNDLKNRGNEEVSPLRKIFNDSNKSMKKKFVIS